MKHKHPAPEHHGPRLELVLKCDSTGSLEAAVAALSAVNVQGVEIRIIQGGVGDISKSDVLMAETASRLIVGYQVGIMPGMERILAEHSVEVRLYDVIYTMTTDISSLARDRVPSAPVEDITGTAKVIALFKSTRKGIIIGCEVQAGHLSIGQRFRIISAMGPVYSGTISSMHIGPSAVQKATPGQQVGIKIQDFNRAKVGDIVEAYRPAARPPAEPWRPRGAVIHK